MSMQITKEAVARLVHDATDVAQHVAVTTKLLYSMKRGAAPVTIASNDACRIFSFTHKEQTAAYLTQFRHVNFDALQADLKLASAGVPDEREIQALAEEAYKVPSYRGLGKLFRARPISGEQAIAQLQRIDPATIHQILRNIDAALGYQPAELAHTLTLETVREQVLADLQRRTDMPVRWVDAQAINTHCEVLQNIAAAQDVDRSLLAKVQQEARLVTKQQAEAEIARTDISVLEQITNRRLRLGPLAQWNLGQLAEADVASLVRIKGVGEMTARQAIAAARSYCEDVRKAQVPVINFQNKQATSAYVQALADLLEYRDYLKDVPAQPLELQPVPSGAHIAVAGQAELLSKFKTVPTPKRHSVEAAWALYAVRAADFHAFGDNASTGNVPAEVAERIADITLQGTLHANLRGYQSFGAKFALAQRKVLIGDEMGLGKTMQSLAVLVHRAATGRPHALVVCPPSLRINWEREINKFSNLNSFMLFGPEKEAALAAWRAKGGVAIAGYPEVRGGGLAQENIDTLIVDEAHRAKNPQSKQSRGVQALTSNAEVVMYLSGTPLENRVEEFTTLLGFLQADVVAQLERQRAKPLKYKQLIAGVYLRRNQADVLNELPPLVEVEEWIAPKAPDVAVYEQAVYDAKFMEMRQAFSGPNSAKMERFMELLEDGADNQRTIVFTYFRSVMDAILLQLDDRAYGPIAGGVNHSERQAAIDAFSAADPETGPVLVCQITAASEGLNIQAANHIVLFEPQLNPAVESQAIARAHRMGQVHTVEVHRLLTPDSVEERLHTMLAHKRALFDQYARDSVAAAAPEAQDVSEAKLIETVIAAERKRLAQSDYSSS